MTSPPVTCHVNDTMNIPAQLMWDRDCGAVVVLNDEGKVSGMLTDRDICMAALTQGRPLNAILANSAMAKSVIAVHPDTPVSDVEVLMTRHQIRRIPVIDADKRPLGVISINDLAHESVSATTRIKQGVARVAHALAAIGRRDDKPSEPSRGEERTTLRGEDRTGTLRKAHESRAKDAS